MNNCIDHIAIGANTLEQGVTFIKGLLGVTIPDGGKHPLMSTHNCLAQAGQSRFIEIIAIDPQAPRPKRKRWFSLDEPQTQERLKIRPRALSWVVNTNDLDSVVKNSPIDLGDIVTLTRADLSWRLTVPSDGSVVEKGLIPAFIQWSQKPHPSFAMSDVSINLEKIELGHPDPAYLKSVLEALDVAHLAEIHTADSHSLAFSLSSITGSCSTID